jgi:hypothetical protein
LVSNLPLQEDKSIAFRLGYVSIEGNYLRAPIPHFGLGTIFGVMPHFVAIETCSFRSKISLGLAPFERSPFLHNVPFGFEPRTLELFGLILCWASLPSIPFSLMPWLLVKELVILLEPGFFALPHIREAFHFHDGFG